MTFIWEEREKEEEIKNRAILDNHTLRSNFYEDLAREHRRNERLHEGMKQVNDEIRWSHTKNQELAAQLSSRDSLIITLREQILELKNQNKNLESANDSLKADIGKLTDYSISLVSSKSQLVKENADLRKEMNRLKLSASASKLMELVVQTPSTDPKSSMKKDQPFPNKHPTLKNKF